MNKIEMQRASLEWIKGEIEETLKDLEKIKNNFEEVRKLEDRLENLESYIYHCFLEKEGK